MKYRFTKRDFKTYLKYVRRSAKQCASCSCVLAQFIERIGGKEPTVCSWAAGGTFKGERKHWHLPSWAQASLKAFDGIGGPWGANHDRMVPAKVYRPILLAIL